MKIINAGIATAVLLTACGGGGGGSSLPAGPVTSTLSFPLQSAYKTNIANGSTVNYTVLATGIPSASNGCHGTASFANATPVSATFETISGFSVTGTITLNLTDCTPASTAVTGVSYFDSNYNPIGSSIAGTEYDVYLTVPSPLPTSVKVGDTAILELKIFIQTVPKLRKLQLNKLASLLSQTLLRQLSQMQLPNDITCPISCSLQNRIGIG